VLQIEEDSSYELFGGVESMKTILTIIALVFAGTAYCFYYANTETKRELARIEFEKQIINISREKEKEMAPLKAAHDIFEADLKKEIEAGQIKIVQFTNRMSIILVDKILFASGEALITPEGSIVLERVGNVLKNTSNEMIRIESYTDTEHVAVQSQTTYSADWTLSTARAANVMLFLQEKVGIETKYLQAIEAPESQTSVSNKTLGDIHEENRIEIVLMPRQAHEVPENSKQLSMW
jgi:chemotaxis protein MotB